MRVLGVSEPEAEKVFDKYFQTLNVFKGYLDRAWKEAVKKLYVKTMVGRRIYIWQLAITERKRMWIKLGEGKNNVYNYPIQSSSAEMVRIMLIKAYQFFSEFRTTKYDINYLAKVTQNSNLMSISSNSPKLEELSDFIDKAPVGNVRIIVVDDNGEVLQQSSKSVAIKWAEAKNFNLTEVM
jgi:DNA polymerase I-like protein with 3'-5' exonuclease and polymerase domains